MFASFRLIKSILRATSSNTGDKHKKYLINSQSE